MISILLVHVFSFNTKRKWGCSEMMAEIPLAEKPRNLKILSIILGRKDIYLGKTKEATNSPRLQRY